MPGEVFRSRWGMMLAMLGMAVGTGNIWRFPRIAAKNGGGEFLVAWIVFLFLWSIPLILLEFGMGRLTRGGPIRMFLRVLGPRWAWMGSFCVFVTSAILCYYSVVAGWTLRYTVASVLGEIPSASPGAFWESYTTSGWPVLTHAVMIALAVFVVARGVRAIERVALVLMPLLILLVLGLAIRALFLPGASSGVEFLFSVDLAALGNPRIWIEALTQNAWDTGAGWGLVLCYAAYMREKEDTALNAYVLPTANNLISLVAAVMVFCTVFSVIPTILQDAAADRSVLDGLSSLQEKYDPEAGFSTELVQETVFAEGSAGITFVWMPQLFKRVPFGQPLMILFFAALAMAAFTSLVAMVEVATRALVDAGMRRQRAILIVGAAGFLLGVPSALNMQVFDNQDWVWSVALMLAGLFFAIAVIRYGVERFRREELNHEHSNVRVSRLWSVVVSVFVPLQAIFLFVWFLIDSWRSNSEGWWKPFDSDNATNVGTVLAQCGIAFAVLIAINRWIVRCSQPPTPAANSPTNEESRESDSAP